MESSDSDTVVTFDGFQVSLPFWSGVPLLSNCTNVQEPQGVQLVNIIINLIQTHYHAVDQWVSSNQVFSELSHVA